MPNPPKSLCVDYLRVTHVVTLHTYNVGVFVLLRTET